MPQRIKPENEMLTMECRTVRNKISSLIDGELSDDDARITHDHLRRCPACAREYRDLASVWDLVAGIPRRESSTVLWTVLAKHIRHEPAAGFAQLRRWVFPALAAGVFTGGIAIGALLDGWTQGEDRVPLVRNDEIPSQVQNFQSISHFADAPPGSLAEGILVSSASPEKRGNEP